MDRGGDGAMKGPGELLQSGLHGDAAAEPQCEAAVRPRDLCDLLLDALDAQLTQLQVHPQKQEAVFKKLDSSDCARLQGSQSLSRDTGLGSTTGDSPVPGLEVTRTPTELTSERNAGCWEEAAAVDRAETHRDSSGSSREKEAMESEREQVIWRLQRLLGDQCDQARVMGEAGRPSDSVCTEDYVLRFRDEMVELQLPDGDAQQRHHALETSNGARFQSEEPRGGKGPEGPEEHLSDSYSARTSEEADTRGRLGAGELDGICLRSKVVIGGERSGTNRKCPPQTRSLAGVPVRSFDCVSIDSDLDSVCTQQVRAHVCRRSGWRSLLQSVAGLGSDLDAASLDDSEPPTAPGAATQQRIQANCPSSSREPARHRAHPAFKAKRDIRETCRHRCPVEDRDADTEEEEETSRPSGRRRSERTSSDWLRMKNHFLALQCRCVEEEEQLQLKTTQIRAAELSLSGLQQRRQHALRELEHIAAERARIGREDVTLALIVKGGRTKKDSESVQQHNLRKQDSCVLEPSVVMSALERDELDRLLSDTKTELFAQKRRAREELEAVQERLEETCEELQRAAEAESFLRSRCSSLEEEQRQDKEQMKLQEQEIRKLQVSLEQERQEAKSREEELQVALKDKRESQEVARQLQQDLQLAVREADGLRVSLEEQQLSAGETEQQLRLWAQQLGAECQLLRHLVEPGGATQGSEPSPPSLTVPETLSHLGALRERLSVAMSRLHQELLSQRQTAELLRHSKEQELNLQRQQLRTERDRDLKTLKERLIQEHIEELSTLTWAPLCDEGGGVGGGGGGEGEGRGGGTAASLSKQLQAKDQELRQVQRRMEQWKEQTAARLACKFEEELTAELERLGQSREADMGLKLSPAKMCIEKNNKKQKNKLRKV